MIKVTNDTENLEEDFLRIPIQDADSICIIPISNNERADCTNGNRKDIFIS